MTALLGRLLAIVFESLLGLILGHSLIPCLGYYSSNSSFFFAIKEEFTLLRKTPDSIGSDILAVISLCVFFNFLQQNFYYHFGAMYHN
jgi:hypothetical protein